MKIKRVSLWKLPLISHEPYHMAEGKSCISTDSMIARVETDTGLSGWGENCPIPHYLPAYAGGVESALDYICLLYTSPSPRDRTRSRMPSSA